MADAMTLIRLRRLIGETDESNYPDTQLSIMLSGTASGNDIYDVASQIMYEKAATQSTMFDVSMGGESLKRSQKFANPLVLAKKYHSMRQTGSIQYIKEPNEGSTPTGTATVSTLPEL